MGQEGNRIWCDACRAESSLTEVVRVPLQPGWPGYADSRTFAAIYHIDLCVRCHSNLWAAFKAQGYSPAGEPG